MKLKNVLMVAGVLGLGVSAEAADYRAGEPPAISRDALAKADYVKGRAAFQARCSACHTVGEGADLAGPNLFGVFSRKVGAKEDFDFSPALKNAGFNWTPARLAAWLADPENYLPNNNMMIPEPVPEKDRLNMLSFMMVESGAADWPRPAVANANAVRDPTKPYAERFPSFWNHMMFNTVRYAFERPGQAEYIVDVYYNTDGSVTSNTKGVDGFWHIKDDGKGPAMFCYALQGFAVEPGVMVECIPIGAMSIPRFNERLWKSKGYKDQVINGGILPGRPQASEPAKPVSPDKTG
ncbi:MAG: c-type cytochrome [Rhodospirillaceae bacterium]|nr:c-type cytochrome [Rhodospirillaceae bacterium]